HQNGPRHRNIVPGWKQSGYTASMGSAVRPVLFVAFSILYFGCTNQKPPEEKRSEAPVPVASVTGSAGVKFGLIPGSCSEGKSRPVIQLIRHNRVVDSTPLEYAASEAPLRKAEGDTGISSREPMEAWTAGKENGSVTTALRAVKLTPEQSGVLVYQ